MSARTMLITRPRGDEAPLTDALIERGIHVVSEPMTEIFLHHTARAGIERAIAREPDAVILTSRHGAQALAALSQWRDVPVVCVGEATAQAALSAGFDRVASAGGDVDRLIAWIADAYDSESRFLYVSAQQVRTDLAEALMPLGMEVERISAYEAVAVTALSDTLIEQLAHGEIDGAAFFSQRSAEIFLALAEKAGVSEHLRHMEAFGLSDVIAQSLEKAHWHAVHAADEPTLASLVESVDNAWHAG